MQRSKPPFHTACLAVTAHTPRSMTSGQRLRAETVATIAEMHFRGISAMHISRFLAVPVRTVHHYLRHIKATQPGASSTAQGSNCIHANMPTTDSARQKRRRGVLEGGTDASVGSPRATKRARTKHAATSKEKDSQGPSLGVRAGTTLSGSHVESSTWGRSCLSTWVVLADAHHNAGRGM